MLIGNYSVLAKHPGRGIGGGAIGLGNNRSDFNKSSQMRGVVSAAGWDYLSAVPEGYRPPYAWFLPQRAGALSARKNLAGAGSFVGAIAGGKNAAATLAGTGTLTGTAALIVSLVAALTGSGTITNAALLAYLQLAAALAGSGDVDGALGALAHATATLDGEGDAAATATALGTLAAVIVVTGAGITTSNVGQAVWSALAAANNDPGTMGEKLNDAGAAANPWTDALPGAYVPGSAGYILGNLASILPPAVWAEIIAGTKSAEELMRAIAAAAAGKSSGHETNTPKYRDLDDTKDVIDATTDANGNRLTVTRDLT